MPNSIFAMEVCLRMQPGASLREDLHRLITGHPVKASYAENWFAYRRASELLLMNLHLIERGCWDYFDDHDVAVKAFSDWSKAVDTGEGARKGPSGASDPYRNDPRYMTFTMAFLLRQDTPTDRAVASLCNIAETRLWHRATFAALLRGMGIINLVSVAADVMYLIPRDEPWGLTFADMADMRFDYLRKLVD